jgi:hypothetical protein
MKYSLIVTSINPPNKILKAISEGAIRNNFNFILIGDVKSPKVFELNGCNYFDIEKQLDLNLKFPSICPRNHYSRKNIGYLIGMINNSDVIVETDDDNIPEDDFWNQRKKYILALQVKNNGWVNIYKYFSNKNIWARGFPLEYCKISQPILPQIKQEILCPIQQGLADLNPDVDAVYRMTGELPIQFEDDIFIALGNNTWHPFNSQNTTWFPESFELMYLPSFCSFRMTDIWRSFVAQRIAWTCQWNILYHSSTVFQERNEHNLLKDFEDEIPGYLMNVKIQEMLDKLKLKNGEENIPENLLICYEELVRQNIILNKKELELLEAWLRDIQTIKNK